MDKIIEQVTFMLEKVEHGECLCMFTSEELFNELYFKAFSTTCKNLEYELLSIGTLRKIVEVYIKNVVVSSYACKSISKLIQLFCEDEIWYEIFIYFKSTKDKFLRYGMAKFLTATLYTFPQHLFCSRMKFVLEDLYKNTDNESCTYNLELLTSLVEFDSSKYLDNNISTCKSKDSFSISSSEDIFSLLCLELSQTWGKLLDSFLRKENLNICLFLNLWKHLCERKLKEEFLPIFLNGEFAVEFLFLSINVPSEFFRLYVDIISQIFTSNLNGSDWNQLEEKRLEEAVTKALTPEFFHLLSPKHVNSPFCSSANRNSSLFDEENIKFDIASKKVILIILNLLSEFSNTLLLCEALKNIFEFLAKQVKNWKPHTTFLWIIDTFIEEDDLLLGVMLAVVRIYNTLKNSSIRSESDDSTAEAFMKDMNPHKILIKFFQQLGNDHNELLSFLLSDETCCLLYLLQYLKLLLTEWQPFIEAHSIFCDNIPASLSIDNSPVQSSVHGSNKLVSYSSSSSSDEEYLGATESNSNQDSQHLKELALKTISVFINLKVAIQKLIDVNEFPYNILPLINLLKICESESYIL